MKILLTGGTGFIGSELIKHLSTHTIVLLTRETEAARRKLHHADLGNITYINTLDSLTDVNHFDAIINLAGEPIAGKRWTKKQKKSICTSRWSITEKLVELIHASTTPPSVFISGSAVGYYGDQQEHPFDESLHVYHEEFTHHVCSTWESIAKKAASESTRVCILRTGLVLGLEGGALPMMLPLLSTVLVAGLEEASSICHGFIFLIWSRVFCFYSIPLMRTESLTLLRRIL